MIYVETKTNGKILKQAVKGTWCALFNQNASVTV